MILPEKKKITNVFFKRNSLSRSGFSDLRAANVDKTDFLLWKNLKHIIGIQNIHTEAKIEAWWDKEEGVKMLWNFKEQSDFLLAEVIYSDTLFEPLKIGGILSTSKKGRIFPVQEKMWVKQMNRENRVQLYLSTRTEMKGIIRRIIRDESWGVA